MEVAHELTENRFKLTERPCRKLNRATLDPRIIGDHLLYVDNHVRSDVLVFVFARAGAGQSRFRADPQEVALFTVLARRCTAVNRNAVGAFHCHSPIMW